MEIQDIINSITVESVLDYLEQTGWISLDSPWEDTYVYGRPEPDKGVRVCVPKSRADYHWYYVMKDTAERISVFESRPLISVLFYLLNITPTMLAK